MSLVSAWMVDCSSAAANPKSRLDLISRPILVVGSVLMQSYQYGSVGWGAQNLWSEHPLATPVEDVITGLVFLVDLPI